MTDPVQAGPIMGMTPDRFMDTMQKMVEQGRAKGDPTIAIALSLDAVAFLLRKAAAYDALEPHLGLIGAAVHFRREHPRFSDEHDAPFREALAALAAAKEASDAE